MAGEAPSGGEAGRSAAADLWPGLVAAVRGKFPAVYPFLSNPAMVQGRLEDGVLTLWVKDEFTKSMVGGASILEELGRLASAQTGVPARCAVKVGKAPVAPAAAAPAQAGSLTTSSFRNKRSCDRWQRDSTAAEWAALAAA